MAEDRLAHYFDGRDKLNCRIKRMSAKNTRIVLENGEERLVPSESVKAITNDSQSKSSRIIPTTPLEIFYRHLRKFTGTPNEKFSALIDRLENRHGPTGEDFIGELFHRSIKHAEFYDNIEEAFYSDRSSRNSVTQDRFAFSLVEQVHRFGRIKLESQEIAFVDYEVFPFRTTLSCHENGNPASRSGAGGMDLLLASGGLPAIGEIKAGTEQVGATFALIQSLMYAAQLLTRNQFERLKKYYPHAFNKNLNEDSPQVNIVLLFEANKLPCKRDLDYAMTLADGVRSLFGRYLGQVLFLQCTIENDSHTCVSLA